MLSLILWSLVYTHNLELELKQHTLTTASSTELCMQIVIETEFLYKRKDKTQLLPRYVDPISFPSAFCELV